ncbi:hypothetical protein A6A04_01710 [Paramagnetospirillum marisnigri]|uniref:Uncharacterized protein n=1 Tax=Paramagnetospirillum marisnigri TaxID=1285242 RepID=A0A178MN00_9PROT|nr:hypothetical protein [Paramagnetospirillum marisnigri]OAN50152.1 hypothetical protein A6A04_01710 [Paramagnetospirillum marisnigri]
MSEDLSGLRQKLAISLPGRIQAAVAGYEIFVASEPPVEAKGFAAWHAAAKSALAHVDLLVKLARWAEGGDEAEDADGNGGIDRMLSQARAALDALDDDEEPE